MKTISTILFATFLIIGTANANPMQWTAGNGHWYDVVWVDNVDTLLWQSARDMADQSGGHLVTLTTAAENAFVWDFLNDNFMALRIHNSAIYFHFTTTSMCMLICI